MTIFTQNITVSENITKRQDFNIKNNGSTRVYPCSNNCTSIDLIYNDNNCKVYFTLDKKQSNQSGADMVIYPTEIKMDDSVKTFIAKL